MKREGRFRKKAENFFSKYKRYEFYVITNNIDSN